MKLFCTAVYLLFQAVASLTFILLLMPSDCAPFPPQRFPSDCASEQIDAISTLYIPLLDVLFKYFLKSTVESLEIKKKLHAERRFTFNTPKKP